MAIKQALMASRAGGRHFIDKIEHVMILGVLIAACTVAVIHGFEKGSSLPMKLVFAMVLVAAVGMEFRAAKNMVVQLYKRHVASAMGWCALWVVCAAGTLYVSFGTAAKNVNDVSALHKAKSNAYVDTRGEIDRTSKVFRADQANVERLRGSATFEQSINGVKVTTVQAAQDMIDRAKADPMWRSTTECSDVKGPKTRAFCDAYRSATAARATAGDAIVRAAELKVAEAALVKSEAAYLAAKQHAGSTETTVSEDSPHIDALAYVANLTPAQARMMDGMQLPLLMQFLLSLTAILMAIEMCRELPRPESKWKGRFQSLWDGASVPATLEASPTPLAPMALSAPGFIPSGKTNSTTTNITVAGGDGLSEALKRVITDYAARMPQQKG